MKIGWLDVTFVVAQRAWRSPPQKLLTNNYCSLHQSMYQPSTRIMLRLKRQPGKKPNYNTLGFANHPIPGQTLVPNLYAITGHGSKGWTLAFGSAVLLADIIDGKETKVTSQMILFTLIN